MKAEGRRENETLLRGEAASAGASGLKDEESESTRRPHAGLYVKQIEIGIEIEIENKR